MSALSEMNPEDRGLLIGLPYRVGIWMSHADDEDGEADDVREMKALEHVIRSIARVHEESPFVQEVARATLEHRDHWQKWADHSFDILSDCEKVIMVLKANVNDNDLKNYRSTLLKIAETVAAAYGEFGMGAYDEETAGLGGFLNKVVGKFRGEEQTDGFMNISPAEEAALERLRTAMRLDGED